MSDERLLEPDEFSEVVRNHLGLLKELRPKQIVGLIAFIGDILSYEANKTHPSSYQYHSAAQKLVGELESFYANRPALRDEVISLSIWHESVFVRLQAVHHLLSIAADGQIALAETYAKKLLIDEDEGVRIDARPTIVDNLDEFIEYGASEQFVAFVRDLPDPQH